MESYGTILGTIGLRNVNEKIKIKIREYATPCELKKEKDPSWLDT